VSPQGVAGCFRLEDGVALRVADRRALADDAVTGATSWHLLIVQRRRAERPLHHQLTAARPPHRPPAPSAAVRRQRQLLVPSSRPHAVAPLQRKTIGHRCNKRFFTFFIQVTFFFTFLTFFLFFPRFLFKKSCHMQSINM